jgi:hypothetical protein
MATLLGLAVSLPSTVLALFSVWRRGTRKRPNGYKEVLSCETNLENVEDVPLVQLNIHTDC